MNILRQTRPAVRAWTLDARPRAPFVRLVADAPRGHAPRLVAAWSLDGSGRLVRAWSGADEPSGRRPARVRIPALTILNRVFRRAA